MRDLMQTVRELNEACGKPHGEKEKMDEEGCGCGDDCDCKDCQAKKKENMTEAKGKYKVGDKVKYGKQTATIKRVVGGKPVSYEIRLGSGMKEVPESEIDGMLNEARGGSNNAAKVKKLQNAKAAALKLAKHSEEMNKKYEPLMKANDKFAKSVWKDLNELGDMYYSDEISGEMIGYWADSSEIGIQTWDSENTDAIRDMITSNKGTISSVKGLVKELDKEIAKLGK